MAKKVWEVLFTITEENPDPKWLYSKKEIEEDVVAGALEGIDGDKIKTELIRVKEVI